MCIFRRKKKEPIKQENLKCKAQIIKEWSTEYNCFAYAVYSIQHGFYRSISYILRKDEYANCSEDEIVNILKERFACYLEGDVVLEEWEV